MGIGKKIFKVTSVERLSGEISEKGG